MARAPKRDAPRGRRRRQGGGQVRVDHALLSAPRSAHTPLAARARPLGHPLLQRVVPDSTAVALLPGGWTTQLATQDFS